MAKKEFEIMETGVLVIGAGGAGLRAAIESYDKGVKVVVLGKSLRGKAHTVMAEGGLAAALANLDSQDNWKIHFRDTFEDGLRIANPKMVEILCREAPQRLLELESWGAIFDRSENGKIMQRAFGAHTCKRVCHVGDRSGLEIMQTLLSQVKKRGIKVLDETIATKILVREKKVLGATAVELRKGKFFFIRAKSIILACGGLCRIYLTTSNSWETIGDGFALAFNAGAKLKDMEMIQFHPTGMVFPESAKGLLVTESVRGEGGILLNSKNERFMEKYDEKRMELSARDIVASAVFNEVREGRASKHGGVYLDISHKPKEFILKKLPKMVKQFKEFAGVDITREKMEVYPTAHYMMGGVSVDAQTCQTAVKGLFACGEVACGVHGANRLGGNSLADILVFGRRAGLFASQFSKEKKLQEAVNKEIEKEYKRVTKPFETKKGTNPTALKKRIQEIMWSHVGLERNEKELNKALKLLKKIRIEAKNMRVNGGLLYNVEWMAFLDVQNMLVTCTAIVKSALTRKESRGAHTRSDYPHKADEWLVNILCKKEKGKENVFTESVPRPAKELEAILFEKSVV